MKKLVKVSLLSMLACAGIMLSSCNAQAPKANLKTDLDSIAYAQGVLQGSQVEYLFSQLQLDTLYKADFINGFLKGIQANPQGAKGKAAIAGELMGLQFAGLALPDMGAQMLEDSTITLSKNNFTAGYIDRNKNPETALIKGSEAEAYLSSAVENRRSLALEKKYASEKEENAKFLEENKSKEGVVTLPSGLQYKVITEGTGPKPTATNQVKVDYHGTNIKGEVFDSSVERGQPATFGLNQVIPGWTEGLQQMPVGSKYILYVPYNLAYGAAGRGEAIGPFATLIFEVELHEIIQ